MSTSQPAPTPEFDLATPQPVEAVRDEGWEAELVTPPPAAWATLVTTGYATWTDATGTLWYAEFPLV